MQLGDKIMKHAQKILLSILFVTLHASGDEAHKVTKTRIHTAEATGLHIIAGDLSLPAGGPWMVDQPYQENQGLNELFLKAARNQAPEDRGRRMSELKDREAIKGRRYRMQRLYWSCEQFAREGTGIAPTTIEQLSADPKLDWIIDLKALEGLFLLPETRLYSQPASERKHIDPPQLLAVDLTPAIDDGKHWILMSNGSIIREAIDTAFLEKQGLTLKAMNEAASERLKQQKAVQTYTIYARVSGTTGIATIPTYNPMTGARGTITWDARSPEKTDEPVHQAWATLRAQHLSLNIQADAPLAHTWIERMVKQYDLDNGAFHRSRVARRGRENRTANAMSVLGGRAAIQETLQLRALTPVADPDAARLIPISEIPGVTVTSHPFAEMLGDDPGGELALANGVPHDRFMAYFPDPEGLFSLLEGGSEFIFQSGSTFTGRNAAYLLKERYLETLGLSETLMKQFLSTGAIEELALVLPDLFLIDGTDVSIIVQTRNPLLTTTALALVGVPPKNGTTIKKNARGEPVYWHRENNLLLISTSASERDHILATRKGENSLGASDEFRYMLRKLPVTKDTSIYVYISDPFIRNLVGPPMKIAQLRRLMARGELEEASASALLARMDGWDKPSYAALVEKGYLDAARTAGPITLDDDFVSHSKDYGSAARMASLQARPVEQVSEAEKKAYETYLAEYNRYWRRFFDPIAMRYDKAANGQHQLDTFILPLIDNSLYNSLQEMLTHHKAGTPLIVPTLVPEPVAMLSLNLNEEAWLEMMEGFGDTFQRFLGLDGALLDLLGPDVHMALMDADPILSLGNGELQTMFGQFGGRADGDMFWIPIFVSMLTRPTTFLLGLQDPDQVREKLLQMAIPSGQMEMRSFGEATLYKVTDEEKWIFKYTVEDIITVRFGLEIQGRYLVLNNMPYSNDIRIAHSQPAANNAAQLSLSPQACLKQLPSLFASAVEKSRSGALTGAAYLTPLMMAGAADVTAAQDWHGKLFGFEPRHPAGGTWTWEHAHLSSSLYGPPWRQQQPSYDPDNQGVGIMNRVADLHMSMQFEEDGLRSTVEWKLK
ncbi:MAG: hypothetical protein ACI97B_003351 [Verrucomicrobiales bacterium]|jgi:hypothetical protein